VDVFRRNILKNLTLEGGQIIDDGAFMNNYLETIEISSSVISINSSAFRANSLSSVTFAPNSRLKSIGYGAFELNDGLTQIELPIPYYENEPFLNWLDFSGNIYKAPTVITDFSVTYMAELAYTLIDDDVVVEDGIIKSCSYDFNATSITIPEVLDGQIITEIGESTDYNGVFEGKGITSVHFPKSMMKIGREAFESNRITNLELPESVKVLRTSSFRGNMLSSVAMPGVTNIGFGAFYGNSLASLEVPESVVEIDSYAFTDNILTMVTFASNSKLSFINTNAFSKNKDLKSFDLPVLSPVNETFLFWQDNEGVRYEGGDVVTNFALEYRAQLAYTLNDDDVVVENSIIKSCSYDFKANVITIPEMLDGQTITGIDNRVFQYKRITCLTLPYTLEQIGEYSFLSNDLTSLTIPSSVTHIKKNAFDTNNLKSVKFDTNSKLVQLESEAFGFNSNLQSIQLPVISPDKGKFKHWQDESGKIYLDNLEVSDFNSGYYSHISYTLSDEDVVVEDGFINLCNFRTVNRLHLIIPETLHGQSVIGISGSYNSDGVFSSRNIYSLQLPETIQNIGQQAFVFNNISEIIIPANVTSIDREAFEHNDLTSLVIPSNLRRIESGAFKSNKLTEVIFSENSDLDFIGAGVYSQNPDFTQFTLPIPNGGDNFLGWKDNQGEIHSGGDIVTALDLSYTAHFKHTLTDADVVVENGVITSCNYDFEAKTIIIPEVLQGQTITGITGIKEDGAFKSKGIVCVVLPSSLKKIGNHAFSENKLDHITIPPNVDTIGIHAFWGNQIVEVIFNSDTQPSQLTSIERGAFEYNKLQSIVIPANVSLIGTEAFSNNELIDIRFEPGSRIQEIDRGAFANNTDLKQFELVIPEIKDFICWEDSEGNNYNGGDLITGLERSYKALYRYTLTDEDVVVENGILRSCSYSFDSRYIIIPDMLDGQTITKIRGEEDNAFNLFGYRGLVEVKLPGSLKAIGDRVFESNGIRTIDLPAELDSIGSCAFINNQLSVVVLPSSTRYIGESAFLGNEGLTRITLPHGQGENIPDWLDNEGNRFKPGDTITDLTKEYTVENFYVLTDEDVEVEDGIVKGCSYDFRTTSIIIPEMLDDQVLTGISSGFANRQITHVTFPPTLRELSHQAFAFNKLTAVELPEGLKVIGEKAFEGNEIKTLTIPQSITRIKEKAFVDNKLSNIELVEGSNINLIGFGAFGTGESTPSLRLPPVSNPNFIGWIDSFGNEVKEGDLVSTSDRCYAAQITYTLTDDDVVVNDGVIDTCSYDFEANVITIPAKLDGQVIRRISYVNYTTANGVDLSRVKGVFQDKGIVKVVLPDSLENIGYNSFRGNDIIILEIPDSIKEIQSRAFIDNQLTQLEFPQCLKTIGDDSFARNSLMHVVLPDSLQRIERFAFMNNNIAEVILPDGLKEINRRAFYGNQLTQITIPGSVARIGESAFSENQLTTVSFEEGNALINIESNAFANNEGLAHIQLPELEDQRFMGWVDDLNNEYLGGQLVDDLSRQYKALYEYTLTDEDVDVVNGTLVRCSWLGRANVIIIPDVLDDQTIVGIGQEVFRSKSLIQVQLPNTLEFIEKYAFQGNKLQQVNLPQSIKRIGRRAFYWNVLKEVVLPVGLDTIGDYSFGENRLEQISLPQSLKYLGNGSFSDNNLIEVTIPESISHIQSSCFSENNLTRVNFLGLVERIDDNAFYENNLEEVILPQSIQYIGNGAFRYNRINSLDLTGNKYLTFIGERAFSDNIGGWKFVLPQSSDPNFAGWADNTGNIYKAGDEVISLDYSYSCMVNGISMRLAGDLDYADVLVNDKNYKQIKVINSGNEPLNINAVKVPDGFESDWNGGVINVGDYHSFYVIFKPLKYEAYSGQLVLTVEGSDVSSSMDITALGIGSAISIPDALDFGKVAIDSTLTKEIRIYNIGNRVLTIDSLRLPMEFSVNWTKGSVSAGESRLIAVSFTPETESVYEVNMAVEGNQRNTDSHYYYTIKGEGVLRTGFEEEFIKNLRLYPNPATDYILLEVDDPSKIEQLEICDLSGRKLYQTDEFSYSTNLQLGNYRTGVYLLIIRNKDGDSLVRKFIKK